MTELEVFFHVSEPNLKLWQQLTVLAGQIPFAETPWH